MGYKNVGGTGALTYNLLGWKKSFNTMSDRVARLAELRQKRAAKKGGHLPKATIPEPSVEKNELVESPESPTPEVAPLIQISENEAVEAVGAQTQSQLFQNIYNQTGTFGELDPHQEEKVTYNSDLKSDLAPYLLRAKKGTHNVINRIIQQKNREGAEES